MLNDLRYAIRMLRKSTGFTGIAVLTLGLGIGANTAIFSFMDALLLRRLPVRSPEQLVVIARTTGGLDRATMEEIGWSLIGEKARTESSYPFYQYLRDHTDVFSEIFAFCSEDRAAMLTGGEAERITAEFVTGSYFQGLGVRALLGRTLTPEDDRVAGGHPVMVLSHGFWERRFGSDANIVGRTISFYGGLFTIIGVSAPGFFGTRADAAPDVYVPLSMAEQVYPGSRTWMTPRVNFLEIMGRLKPEISVKQAEVTLSVINRQWLEATIEEPDRLSRARAVQVVLLPGSTGLSSLRKQYSHSLLILMATVGLVLLIACMNVANMLLARAAGRQREMAVRLAMGATRNRLVQQLVTESLLLALLGGALGILVAFECNRVLLAFLPQGVEAAAFDVQPDLRVLGFTLCLSLLTGLLFGLTPARQTTKPDLTPTLRGEVVWMGSPRRRLGDVLVVTQVSFSLLLLIGAGLLVRTLQKLKSVHPGFNRENVLMLSFYPHMSGYTSKQTMDFFEQLVERFKVLPGVRAVSLDRNLGSLSGNSGGRGPMHVHGYQPGSGEDVECYVNFVGVRYFEMMGIPLLLGRDFGAQDNRPEAPKVAIINQTMAHHFFGNEKPVGMRFGWGPLGVSPDDMDMEVVGVVRDTKYESLRETNQAVAYIPYQQEPQYLMTLVVRTAVAPANMVAAIRREAQALDSRVPILQIKTLSQQVNESLRQERLLATLSGFFGLLALVLASMGLYGMINYSVTRRTHEIGIRMALGAQQRDILKLVLAQASRLILIGVGVGLAGAVALTRVVSSFLFGVTTTDPTTLIGISLLLTGVALFASYVPARRATKIDPMVALRCE